MRRVLHCTALVVFALAAAPAGAAEDSDSDEAKTLYALGAMVGGGLDDFHLQEDDLEPVLRGLRDAVLRNDPAVDPRTRTQQIQSLRAERMKAAAAEETQASAAYLERIAKVSGAQRRDSGLVITELRPGEGDSPSATDTVKVHYHGTLRDGTVFDSSVDRGTPAQFPLNRVIPCWTEGVQEMKVGGKSRLVCPPEIAYGDRGSPGSIPGGAVISFEVELIEIVR